MHVVTFLRNRFGLTKQQLAQKTHLTSNNIIRMERGKDNYISKAIRVAAFFQVPVDAVVCNDTEAVYAALKTPITPQHRFSLQMEEREKIRRTVGRQGEDWVYQREREKLAGTVYENAVNPNFADDLQVGFDILSFRPDGTEIYIEVKSTKHGCGEPFSLSAGELKMAKKCLAAGWIYEVHRVYREHGITRCLIIPAAVLLKDYQIQVESYMVRRKSA